MFFSDEREEKCGSIWQSPSCCSAALLSSLEEQGSRGGFIEGIGVG
jgi:hypothetical protein